MENDIPLNETGAGEFIRSIEDSVVRNLVSMAFGNARLEMATGNLPAAPFDMEFYVKLVHMTLRRRDVVQSILDGKSVAEATGWDV